MGENNYKKNNESIVSTAPVVYQVSSDEEVSLVDLTAIVVRHQKVFYFVVGFLILIGLCAALVIPKKYLYSTVVEVGSYKLTDTNGVLGASQLLETIERSKNKLERHFITEAVMKHHKNNPEAGLPEVSVEAPKDSNIIVISTVGTIEENSNINLLNEVANKLVLDHHRKSEDIMEQLRQNVGIQVLKAEELKADLKSHQQEIKLIKTSLETMNSEEILFEKQIERKNIEIEKLTQHRNDYIKEKSQSKEALAILLIDNEIRHLREQRDVLEHKKLIGLVSERGLANKKIEDLQGKLIVVRKALENVLGVLKRYGIESVESAFSTDQIDLFMNMQHTEVVVKAFRSVNKVGIGRTAIVLFSGLVGVLLGLLSCFLFEFALKVKLQSIEKG